jgi:hypothetical protein
MFQVITASGGSSRMRLVFGMNHRTGSGGLYTSDILGGKHNTGSGDGVLIGGNTNSETGFYYLYFLLLIHHHQNLYCVFHLKYHLYINPHYLFYDSYQIQDAFYWNHLKLL